MTYRRNNSKPPCGTPLNRGHPLSDNLLACWLFNENGGLKVRDSVGESHASWAGTGSRWYPNPKGPGGKFNGSDNGVTQDQSMTLFNTANYTVSARVTRLGSGGGGGNNPIAGHGPAANTAGHWFIYVINASSKVSVDIPFVLGNVVTSNATISTNIEYQIDLTRSGNVYTLYINGRADATATNATAATLTGKIYIGTYENNPWWNGLYDHLKIWGRALTPTEIALNYEQPYCMFDRPKWKKGFQPAANASASGFNPYYSRFIGRIDGMGASV